MLLLNNDQIFPQVAILNQGTMANGLFCGRYIVERGTVSVLANSSRYLYNDSPGRLT